ncbi:carbon-nitrogen hydrolase family protein [Alphaproteobacteria bacterium]|nr:carbon-nitrogen hydrolase family protein [Alphaproteobacteria bacterium]MDC1210290.1 carbon-nitrogen hydrolase family protein [Pseudomonadota bacterium]
MYDKSNVISVSCLQYTSTTNELRTLEMINPLINKAIDLGSDIIALPECATALQGDPSNTIKLAKTESENISLKVLKEIAKTNSVHILIGSLPIKTNNKITNRSFLIGPNGKTLYKYDKIHMFDVNLPNGESYKESNTYSPGSKAVLAKVKLQKIVKIGMTICYDLRFPNLFQDLAINGAEIITVPSAFSKNTGKLHWHTLLRARAIETGCFIIAPAQTGNHSNGRKTYGHSLIISPWGRIIADAKKETNLINAKINLDIIKEARLAIPNLNAQRKYLTDL